MLAAPSGCSSSRLQHVQDNALGPPVFLQVERYKAPRDKLLCLVNVKTMVEGIVAAAVAAGADIGGAGGAGC